MRSDEHGGLVLEVFRSPNPEDIAHTVDDHFQPGLVQPTNEHISAGFVGVGRRQARQSTRRVAPNAAQRFQARKQPLGLKSRRAHAASPVSSR